MKGRNILATAGSTLLLVGITAGVVETFRHPVGTFRELEGTVQSVAAVSTTGSALHGANTVLATVQLSSGALVQASVASGIAVFAGSPVMLREYSQSFGGPRYAVVALRAQHGP